MEFRGYLKTSAIEWPGKIAAVLFVSRCNFRCPFCHNRDLVLISEKLPRFSEKEIFRDLERRKKWVEAVVITGGEPTLQPDLERFLQKCKKEGFLTMIETNGSKSGVISKLIKNHLLDYLAMDIKGPLDFNYAKIVNSKLQISQIKKSVKLIIDSGVDFEFRTTVVPGIHNRKVLVEMAQQLASFTGESKSKKRKKMRWFLQAFQPKNCLNCEFEKIKPYTKAEMEEFLSAVKKTIPEAKLRSL